MSSGYYKEVPLFLPLSLSSLLSYIKLPLRQGHLFNQDTLICPGHNRDNSIDIVYHDDDDQ